MPTPADSGLVASFRRVFTETGLSPEDFAERYANQPGDPSSSTIRRWAIGEPPTRMTGEVRTFFRRIVQEESGPEGSRVIAKGGRRGVHGVGPSESRWPDPEPGDPADVKQYLTFFGAEADAFRRMAKRLPLSDIAKGCLEDARAEDMPEEHFAILYDRLAHLL